MRITDKTHILNCAVLFFTTLISRIFLLEKFQSHWDGPQYSIALFRYSIADNTPASPGYPIYIGIGKFLNLFANNPHLALTIESAVFNALGAVVIYFFAKSVFNQPVALIAAAFYVTSPVIYFFGLTAYAYGVDVVFYLLFAFACYSFIVKKKRIGLLVGSTFGLLIGFRPQDLLFAVPLFLLALFYSKKNEMVKILLSTLIVCFLWLVPVIIATGGINLYIGYLKVAIFSMRNAPHLTYLKVGAILVKGLILTTGIGVVFPLLFLITNHFRLKKKKYKSTLIYFVFWMLPPFLFNVIIRSDHAGYQLSYLIPFMLLCAASLYSLFRKSYYLKAFIIAVILVNFVLFFRNRDVGNKKPYIPTSFHYSEIVKNDHKMEEKIGYIKDNFNPSTTLILVGGSDYFRPVMYYFPEFRVIQLNRLTSNDRYYENFVRAGYQYKMKEYRVENNYYKLPRFVSTIVCFDDECKSWWKNNGSVVKFDESTSIVVVETSESSLLYGFGKLRVN